MPDHSSSDTPNPVRPADESRPIDQVQRWLQAVITHPGGITAGVDSAAARSEIATSAADVERVILRSKALGSLDRLAVYGNAYYARLLECLRESFPIVCRTMGERIFNQFAFVYLQRHPSQSYTLGELGARFADFLAESQPAEADDSTATREELTGISPDWPQFVVDLARLEWTIGQVYDGPGMEQRLGLSAADLAQIPQDRWSSARLTLAPCVRLLHFRFPVNDYYAEMRELQRDLDEVPESTDTANASDDGFVPIPLPRETYLALSRRDYIVHRYALSKAQYALLRAVESGATIESAIAAASSDCDLSDDDFAAALHRWFAIWTADQFFAGVSLE